MRKLLIYVFLFLLPTTLMSSSTSIAATPGMPGVKVVTRHGEKINIYKDYHALVMGVGSYKKWPELGNAVSDAKEVAESLRNLGFHVKLVLDPTYKEMKSALKEMVFKMGSEVDRAVLFYYAGHGYTQTLPDKTRMGYIIPTDCPLLEEDSLGFITHAISMKEIESASLKISSKHVIMLFDSCFSMSLFALFRAVPDDITKKSSLPVRQFITAGRENESMPDKSIFKRCFLKGLAGDADLIGDGYITGSELGMYLQQSVADYTKRRQHPQYAKINNPDFDTGDFIFVPLRVRQTQLAEAKKAQEEKERLAKKEREEIRGIEEAKINQLEAERKAALENARKEAAEKKALEEELKRVKLEQRLTRQAAEKKALEEELKKLKAAKAGEQDKTKMMAARRADEQQARKVAAEKKALEEKLKRLKEEREADKSQQKQLAYIPKSHVDTQTKPRKIAFFPCRFENRDVGGTWRFDVPGQTVISASILRLTEQLDKSQVPTTFYSVYSSEKSEKITDEFIKAQQIDEIWKRKSSFSDDYITNDGIIYKAGKELGVDMVIIFETAVIDSYGGMQKDVNIYLYDISTNNRYHSDFPNNFRYDLPDTYVISNDTAKVIAKYINDCIEGKIAQK